jgi:hypothetical protein
MPFQTLSLGTTTQILQNVVYNLPAASCDIRSSVAIEGSHDGSTFAALTGAETTGVRGTVKCIRCTTGNANVTVR